MRAQFLQTAVILICLSSGSSYCDATVTNWYLPRPDLTKNWLVWELNATSDVRAAARAVGEMQNYYTDNNLQDHRISCPAAIISSDYLLAPSNCAPSKMPGLGDKGWTKRVFEIGAEFSRLPDAPPVRWSTFDVDTNPIEVNQTLGYAIYRVGGNPAKRFGVVKLQASPASVTDALFVVNSDLSSEVSGIATVRFDCHFLAAPVPSKTNIEYQCGGAQSPLWALAAPFVFSAKTHLLVAFANNEVFVQLGKDAKVAAIPPSIPSTPVLAIMEASQIVRQVATTAAPPQLPPIRTQVQDLQDRMELWNDLAFTCPFGKNGFPSKEDGDDRCDDGDMTLFNGLLCAAGDARGCDAVKALQGPNGRWWRSPKRINTKEAQNDDEQASFSTDQALGVWAYLAERKDDGDAKRAFEKWTTWINNNKRCGARCIPPGGLRYCEDDRCTFKAIDCLILDRLAQVLGLRTSVCTPIIDLPSIPLPADFQQQFDGAATKLQSLLTKFHLLEPPGLRQHFDAALKAYTTAANEYAKANENFAKAIRAAGVKFPANGYAAATIALINSQINGGGSPRHLAAVEVFLLKKYGLASPDLTAAGQTIAHQQPNNPFFEYVANDKSQHMLDLILQQCPSRDNVLNHARLQWSWERDAGEQAWLQTMYWDCFFAANLYLHGSNQFAQQRLDADKALNVAIGAALAAEADVINSIKNVFDFLDTLNAKSALELGKNFFLSPCSALPRPPIDPCKTIGDIGQLARNPTELLENPGRVLALPIGGQAGNYVQTHAQNATTHPLEPWRW